MTAPESCRPFDRVMVFSFLFVFLSSSGSFLPFFLFKFSSFLSPTIRVSQTLKLKFLDWLGGMDPGRLKEN